MTTISSTPEQTAERVNLTLQDLQAVVNVIQVCSQRGAFKAEELAAVGQLFNKVVMFLDQNTPKQPEEPPATPTDTVKE
jgi:hypothetical protein